MSLDDLKDDAIFLVKTAILLFTIFLIYSFVSYFIYITPKYGEYINSLIIK